MKPPDRGGHYLVPAESLNWPPASPKGLWPVKLASGQSKLASGQSKLATTSLNWTSLNPTFLNYNDLKQK